MRTERSPECDTIRALFSGAKRQNFDGKRACVPRGIDGGMRTIGREPPNDSHLSFIDRSGLILSKFCASIICTEFPDK